MEESFNRLVHALLYSAVTFGIGMSHQRRGRGLAWQLIGMAALLLFVVLALVRGWLLQAFVCVALLVAEGGLVRRYWRARSPRAE